MPFIEHLRELRSRLSKSTAAILLGTVLGYAFYGPLIGILKKPACAVHNVQVLGSGDCGLLTISGVLNPFSLQLKVSLAAGLVLSAPVWLYQLWAFLAPGLHRAEKRYTVAFVASGFPLFVAGSAISYWVLPKAMGVLQSFTPQGVSAQVPLDEYITFVIRMVLVFGLAFELPLVLLMLNFAGVLSARRMGGWWRFMLLGITVFAAVATPTGDPLTMGLLAIPMMALYGIGVGLAWLNDQRRRRRDLTEGYGQISDDEASEIDTRPSSLDDLDDIS